MLRKFSERFKRSEKIPGISFVAGSSRTKQSFKKDCDINFIMKKYRETGLLPEPQSRPPFFGDFTNAADFLENQNRIAKTQQYFERLPALTRERFGNDPSKMLDFLADIKNKDEAIKLGLVRKPAPDLTPKPPIPPQTPPPAPPVPPVA